ncbi:hypothetical protein [Sphingobium sp.]|uniref:hypothetical protein n=1 Tax=Sphingobium sp. TaxID=1912891 RepID=UPI003BB7D848
MKANYQITPDRSLNLMRVQMEGFFNGDDVQRFAADYREALSKIRSPGHLTMLDIIGMKIQAQDVAGGFTALLASPDVRSRKLAFVCGSSLARLQAQRIADRDGVEFFENAKEAEAWLFA